MEAQISTSNHISLREAKIILSDYLVFALLDVFPFELAVFVDYIVQRVDVHVGAETDENVAHHFVDFY